MVRWKNFYDTGTNWKDLSGVQKLEDYKNISREAHLSNAKKNPIYFLKKSGKGFFTDKDGYVIALHDSLAEVVQSEIMKKHIKDIIDYRTMEYYRRRYQEG